MTTICLRHIRDDMYEIVDCETGQPIGIPLRPKKPPSKYNIFMKECIQKKTGPIQERFKTCAAEYKMFK